MSKNNWYNPNDKRFKWSPERLEEVAKSLNDWVDNNIAEGKDFLLGDWCFAVGFLPSYFARYRERCKALDEAYNKAKEWQEHNIAKGALYNKLNSKFAALWLAHAHSWTINSAKDEKVQHFESAFEKFHNYQIQKGIDTNIIADNA